MASNKLYDILISCAEEDNEIATELAVMLQSKGITVFYDKFKEAEKWGKNSIDYDNEVFTHSGRYCVVILSQHFGKSQVTNLQRQIIQSKASQQDQEYILPVRLDDSPVDPDLDRLFCVKYRRGSTEEIASLVCQKLGIPNGNSLLSGLRHLFQRENKPYVSFEMQSGSEFTNPFLIAVSNENNKIIEICNYQDIRIVGCDVMPHQ
jgi:hypothetical protein